MRFALLREKPQDHCQVIAVAPSAKVAAVALYEPDKSRSFFGSGNAAPVTVDIAGTGDYLLVLNAYRATTWQIRSNPEASIAGVVLIGNHASTVEGPGPQTPVLTIDHEGRRKRPVPAAGCGAYYEFHPTAYDGGPGALLLYWQIKALTGRGIQSLQGAYKGAYFEVR